MSEAMAKALREALTPPWLQAIDLSKVANADKRDLAIALSGLLALLDFARGKIAQDDWQYMMRQVDEIMVDVLR